MQLILEGARAEQILHSIPKEESVNDKHKSKPNNTYAFLSHTYIA